MRKSRTTTPQSRQAASRSRPARARRAVAAAPGAEGADDPGRDLRRKTLISADLARGKLSDEARRFAVEILEVMAHGVERQVREALSEHVRMSPFLPPAVAAALAADVGPRALPVIRNAGVLSDRDLIAVVCRSGEEGLTPLAPCAPGSDEAAERALLRILKEFGESGDIQALIVERLALPLSLSEELIARISRALCDHLVTRHGLPRAMADELAMHGRERALTQAMGAETRGAEIERLAAVLHAKGALSPTLILRALCAGNLTFFQAALAARAGIAPAAVDRLVFGSGRDGLERLCREAGLPGELFGAFRSAIDVVHETNADDRNYRPLEVTERIIARLKLEYDSVCPEGLEHTLSQLSRFVIGRVDYAARGLA
jgi:uncharacterized protein (DUF2336 family)